MNLNRVTIAGHLTRDVEVRFTPKGTAVSKAGIAINRKWKDRASGQFKEEATFIDVEAFGKTAELFGKFKKGENVFFEGRLRLDTWDDKQSGQKRSKLIVLAETSPYRVSYADISPPADAGKDDDVPF